jgi:molybdate-binding protein
VTDLHSRVRARRADAGLSQAELARRVGVSRQAIAAIEAGRQVPSTAVALQLARALRCAVEDLFALRSGPRLRAVWSPAGSHRRVALGKVDGVWTAHGIAADEEPADGVVIGEASPTGEIDVEPLHDLRGCEDGVFIAGCAPLLGILTGCLRRRGRVAAWVRADSTRALDLLAAGSVHVAGLHFADASSVQGHRELVRARFPDRTMVIVSLTQWRQGLVVRQGNPHAIRTIADAVRPDVRFVGRARGSGAHRLAVRLLEHAGVSSDARAPAIEASGHAEVARLVALGLADAGIAFEGAARAEGLDFIPLAQERFDLVVPADRQDQRPVAEALALLEHHAFRAQAARLPGYDLAHTGESDTVAGS